MGGEREKGERREIERARERESDLQQKENISMIGLETALMIHGLLQFNIQLENESV